MSSYTLPLKRVMDLAKDPGTGNLIGLGRYPIFDEKHRLTLNRKIINHYWNQEIGMESVSLFTFALERKMNEIMPLYNQVYKSALLEFDPISNYKLVTDRNDKTTESRNDKTSETRKDSATETANSDSKADSTATSKSGSRTVDSEMPQTMLRGDADYASSANDSNVLGSTTSDSTNSGNSSKNSSGNASTDVSQDGSTDTELDGTTTTTGYQGSPADLLMKYRATLLNTDMLIVDDLAECFMQIWPADDDVFIPQILRGYRY